MKTTLFAGASVGLCILASATAASAQSIDYGAMEQLFNEPVTTSATGSPQRATEAPADMQIISADDIRRSGEITIPGLLQRVAGIDVLNFSAGQSDVNVRGYDQVSSPRLLVLVNGRQVYLDHYGLTVWATIPVQLDEIRQIEVVKGPNSALFGFNAVSGVVNIITFNPKFDDRNVATVRVGTMASAALRWSAPSSSATGSRRASPAAPKSGTNGPPRAPCRPPPPCMIRSDCRPRWTSSPSWRRRPNCGSKARGPTFRKTAWPAASATPDEDDHHLGQGDPDVRHQVGSDPGPGL
jgi:outer membrane receptor protein involved in Fe transport